MNEPVETLADISKFVGGEPDGLAVTVAARDRDAFAVLVATILSLRTRDEVTQVAVPALMDEAPTPQMMWDLPEARIAELIYPTSFYRMKAGHIRSSSRTIIDDFNGAVPDTIDGLLKLKGVGRKSANLIYNLAFGKPGVCVDTHVHRISNRLGWIQTHTPEESEKALEQALPEDSWIPVNGVLIAFGRRQCTPVSPKCSTCPISKDCPRVGVGKTR